ncbi:MerR family transcriptional regulator [Rhodococcus sp. G-MC3]|uniref:MerR family transcriptional regulator n=1 Tax=Rhodococcus sp. G-MC3 TaxID=3046209 RepID=UPI0024BA2DC2|nr:MerR family transcriptional regulator [Rhodococcus sp. G-MC3]MDJ0394372.1 MerR family transcriptional regulator [Rhodococcus sp. G-MC3]
MKVGEVARLVGISVRALHHYDEISLVVPSGRTPKGYRSYSAQDVERLHQVLTYRELGFALDNIADLLDDPSVDAMVHLQRQRALLDVRIDRLHQMAAAVDKMMEAKKMGIQLSPEEQREVFGDNWLGDEYAVEAEERWSNSEEWKQSQSRTASFSKEDWVRVKAETDALEADFAAAMALGVAADSDEGSVLAERHRESIERYYDCGYEMHACLGEMYIADERFTKHYDDVAPGLAQYLRDAIVANAARHG